ncbi:hypothetical protein VDG1235_3957 [Verrucomicrobiia bacterium DG1235]|nr:hypothetical protein VDG1235_3957 [Verrucomicrobiae bacterium DG1235]
MWPRRSKKMIDWIESHKVTVDLAKWAIVILFAWAAGVFRLAGRFLQRPKLELYGPAGFCYLQDYHDKDEDTKGKLAVFVINPVIKNPTLRSFEIDRFFLGYRCKRFFRSYRQKLFHVSFPARPTKKMGDGLKILPVYFTNYGDGFDEKCTVEGFVEPRRVRAAYSMFISNTWGSWDPIVKNEKIEIKLTATTIGEGTLTRKVKLPVVTKKEVLDDFCNGLYDYVQTPNTWNLAKV